MYDFLIGTQDSSLNLEDNKMHLTKDTIDYLRQKLRCRLNLNLYEYAMATNEGVPYVGKFEWTKAEHIAIVVNTIQIRILDTEGISKLNSFTYTLDNASRTLTVNFVAVTDENIELSDSVMINI